MRNTFIKTLVELAEQDSRIVLLTGDLGFMVLETFQQKFPARFFNVGVAEQNMVGLATGLAEAGFIPFVYSIATFASLRPYEFIRNGPILHKLPVRIIGIGGGFEYGYAGVTHHGLEDVGIMRIQPGITLITPADYEQAYCALMKTWDLPGPVYYRLGKDDKTRVSGLGGRFELNSVQLIGEGTDLLIVAMGNIANEAVAAAKILADREKISSTVMVAACMNPAPIDDMAEALSRFRSVLTVEAHYVTGGIGSLVSEIVAERDLNCKVVRCGARTKCERSGSQSYLRDFHGISCNKIVHAAVNSIANLEG